MGLFSANLLAELAKGLTGTPPETYPMLKLQAPGQTFRWTSKGYDSLTHGTVQERVLDWGGEFGPEVNLASESVDSWEMRVVVADMGESEAERRQFAREFAKYRGSLRRSPATLYPFLSPNVADVDQFSIPLLVASANQAAPMIFEVTLKPDDTIFQQGVLQKVPLALYFPDANPDDVGGYAPIVYGEHDSNGVGGKGMTRCLHMDTVGHRYLISLGYIKTLAAVYKDGTLVASANYTFSKVIIRGTQFSLVDFTADQNGSEITVDCDGLTENGDGTGALISNPVDIWRHAMVQLGYNDWRQGTFFANSTAPIDMTSIDAAADYLDRASRYKGSFYIPSTPQMKLREFTDLFLRNHPLFGYWSPAVKLSLGFIDENPPATIYPTGSAFIEGDVDEEDGFASSPESSDLITKELNVQYIKNENTGEYGATLKVADLSIDDEVSEELQLDWARRAVV